MNINYEVNRLINFAVQNNLIDEVRCSLCI